jgi:hypothetical protein
MPDHSPDKPEPKRIRLIREITNYKLQTWGVLRTDLNAFGVESLRFFKPDRVPKKVPGKLFNQIKRLPTTLTGDGVR